MKKPPHLSPRQREVASLFLAGKTNLQIARALKIKPGTVGRIMYDIRAKIGITGGTSASLALALQAIMLKTEPQKK